MTEPTAPRPAWIDDFSIPPEAAGVVLALDFSDDGVWAARLTRDLTVEQVVTEPRITPTVLDVRAASFLRDAEVVPEAGDPETFVELLDICRRARGTLIDRDSVLLMGKDKLRLVTVTLEVVMSATVPEVNRVHGMIVELAGSQPVAAVFLGPGADDWPGLWEALTARGFAMLLPDDDFPETFAGDEDSTTVLEPVGSGALTSLAWAESPDTGPVPAPESSPAAQQRRSRLVIAAAVLALVAATGAGVAVATMSDDEPDRLSPTTEAAADRSIEGVSSKSGTTPTTVEPNDIRAARAPMKRYATPTSKPSSSSKASEAPLGPRPRPKQRPHRRTIPNPIPGLPPIVIG